MNVLISSLLFLFIISQSPLHAGSRQEEMSHALKEIQTSLSELRIQYNNHKISLKCLEEKIQTQDSTVDSLRQEVLDVLQTNKEIAKSQQQSYGTKFSKFEKDMEKIVGDLKVMKAHVNESSTALHQYQQKFIDLEKSHLQLQQHLSHLENAVRMLMELIGQKDGLAAIKPPEISHKKPEGKSYKVKAGDSLEKIAKEHGTTIQILKEINQFPKDKDTIRIGQQLLIPE